MIEGITMMKRPRLKNPFLICAWPGMGEVAFKAVHFLVEALKAEQFAEIPPEEFFYLTASTVKDGLVSTPEMPHNTFYFWKHPSGGTDLIIFLSNAQPDLAKAEAYSRRLLDLARSFKVKRVVTIASMPQPVDHMQEPRVWYSATSASIVEELKGGDISPLPEGQISGMNGLFLSMAKRAGLDGFCLLGEIPLYTIQIENPKASHAVLSALAKIVAITVDFAPLLEQARAIDEEIDKLLDYLKVDSGPGPISEEDIDKIKKSLSELSKLPASVKEKIEALFLQAQEDLTRAHELKGELDRWNVYKEYEDRFLDLFKKKRKSGN